MTDRQERLGGSLVQHGPDSDRIYLMELAEDDMPDLVRELDELARRRGYSKVFAKVPGSFHRTFKNRGYSTEALVPRFFAGRDDGHFMAKYLDPARAEVEARARIDGVLRAAEARAGAALSPPAAPEGYDLRPCTPDDVGAMARLYDEVFPSYPFPIHRPGFLAETMESHVAYFGAWHRGELTALASAETYPAGRHAEMTDFATDPEHRGRGLALALLALAEDHARAEGYVVAYTIARALSFGMNITFAKGGYRFAGTLINNTQISGDIESMNVWYKLLA